MGLSSKVMNMKFMRSAEDKAAVQDEPVQKKVQDESEWALKNVKKFLNPVSNIQSVGYGSINSFDNSDDEFLLTPVKRQWGAKDDPEETIEFTSIKDSAPANKISKNNLTKAKASKRKHEEVESEQPEQSESSDKEVITDFDPDNFLSTVFKPKENKAPDDEKSSKNNGKKSKKKLQKRKRIQ